MAGISWPADQIIITLYIILVTGWFVEVSILVWSANDVIQ